MFKSIFDTVWAFDVEWVPDHLAGRLLYGDALEGASEGEVLDRMWQEGGATSEDPTPFLKTIACRVVSVAAVERKVTQGGVRLNLLSLPRDVHDPEQASEAHILRTFMTAIGDRLPQLVGFNSNDADLKILIQRSLVNSIRADGFNRRPDKPWLGIDYYARDNDCHVDIKQVVSGWGKGTPSLHELATLCGIPGKIDMDGDGVAGSWLRGEHQQIVNYNECDAITTYLVWLRLALFGGKLTEDQYVTEIDLVRELIAREGAQPGKEHLVRYAEAWDRLERLIERYDESPPLFVRHSR